MIVWEQTVDEGRFRCWVEQVPGDGYRGVLRVEVAHPPEIIPEILLDQPVGISYAAAFGPDVSDVGAWQMASINAIDKWIAEHPG